MIKLDPGSDGDCRRLGVLWPTQTLMLHIAKGNIIYSTNPTASTKVELSSHFLAFLLASLHGCQ